MPFTGMNEPKFMPQLSNNNTSLLPNRNLGMGAFNNQSSFNLGNTSMPAFKDMKLSDMKLGDMKLGKLGTSSLNNSVIQALNKNQNTFDTVNPALNTSLFGNFNDPGFFNRKSTLRKAPSKDYKDNETPFDQMMANRQQRISASNKPQKVALNISKANMLGEAPDETKRLINNLQMQLPKKMVNRLSIISQPAEAQEKTTKISSRRVSQVSRSSRTTKVSEKRLMKKT